eukprot:Pompholyxophrys_punicea_v1_NODE_399_length_2059_cov_2.745509.p2 type:complete len:160 gc:universal NODE_399_length_2059_cov_2.745509:773-1252(+)
MLLSSQCKFFGSTSTLKRHRNFRNFSFQSQGQAKMEKFSKWRVCLVLSFFVLIQSSGRKYRDSTISPSKTTYCCTRFQHFQPRFAHFEINFNWANSLHSPYPTHSDCFSLACIDATDCSVGQIFLKFFRDPLTIRYPSHFFEDFLNVTLISLGHDFCSC